MLRQVIPAGLLVTIPWPWIVTMRLIACFGVTTCVEVVALLLFVCGSAGEPLTLAELVSVPVTVGFTVIVTVALAPLARLPRVQVTVVVPLQLPWVAEAETKVAVLGSGSVTVTPVAAAGPVLVTVSNSALKGEACRWHSASQPPKRLAERTRNHRRTDTRP